MLRHHSQIQNPLCPLVSIFIETVGIPLLGELVSVRSHLLALARAFQVSGLQSVRGALSSPL